MDAAEQIVKMVGADLTDEQRRAHIQAAQEEIVRDELPSAPSDYRAYLNSDAYGVGSESLAHVGSRKIATLAINSAGIVRNMVGALERADRKPILVRSTGGSGESWDGYSPRWRGR